MSKQREDFEKWVKDRMYHKHITECLWDAWKQSQKVAVPDGFVLVNAEQLNRWGHMANYAEQYGCPECFESRGYAHTLSCEINEYFAIEAGASK